VTDDRVPAGPVLDALGVTIELGAHQQLTECVVVGKVTDFADGDTGPALVIATSEGLDWVAQRGLLSTGLYVLDNAGCTCDRDAD
jgi:hypothetical protein